MPMLPGTIEQDQMMPQVAPQFAPPVSPVPMPQMLGTQMSPYIGSGAYQAPDSPSVLNTPDINKAIQQQTLAQIQALGNNSSDKRDRIRNIFTGIMAPAMAIFGGAGTAAAGADLIQQARQQAVIGKQQGLAEKQNAAAALKGLVDIENTIRLKPLGEMMKNQRQQERNATQAAEAERKRTQGNRRLMIQENRNNILASNYKRMGDLKERKLNIDDKRLEQVKSLAEMRDHTLREIAVLQSQARRGIADQSNATRMAALTQQFQMQQAKLGTLIETHNQNLRAEIEKHNNLVRQKGAGELLNADQYMLQFNGIDHEAPQEEPDDEDYRAALQAVMQPAQAQPAQAPAAAPQKPAANAQAPNFNGRKVSPQTQQSLLQKVQQRYGMNFQQATEYLKSNGLM